MVTIYMALLNEGTDVWRPVEATLLSADTYRVEGEVPDAGTVVRCERKTFGGGEAGLTAIRVAG